MFTESKEASVVHVEKIRKRVTEGGRALETKGESHCLETLAGEFGVAES